jgi:arginine decarboxylase
VNELNLGVWVHPVMIRGAATVQLSPRSGMRAPPHDRRDETAPDLAPVNRGKPRQMKQEKTPVLDALADYHRSERYGFSPPGHRQGRGADERALAVLGKDPFRDDVLASGGLDDRMSRGGYLTAAEDLMAEAVGAQTAFFSTCGSSLSVKAAMMAVAGGSDGGLLLSRDSHKSVVAGLVLSGVHPRWISPQWDAERHFAHPPSPDQVRQA